MTENVRTATYIGVALVLLVVAGLVNRKPVVETDEPGVGTALFRTELKSADDVAGLEIVTADDTGGTSEFRVVRGPNGWSLPLHNDYPADAEKEVASAAASLIDLKVLSVVSSSTSSHAEYGVVDPENASPGAEGVGKLVKVLDKSGNDLVRLIVGKQDAQAGDAMDSQELRFVRVLPQDAVYRVAMPSAKFSANFADWIETDLLKLDPWDITDVTLRDYTFDIAPNLSGQFVEKHDQLSTIELAFNDKDSKWSLEKLVEFKDDKPYPVELGADEELNSVKLNEMKTALDDLKIVDVRPKPAGMSANLKANKNIVTDQQAVQSLVDRGFYPVRVDNGPPEILSSDGEVLVQMKDGTEYTLRFGGVAGIGKKEDEADADAKKEEKAAGKAKDDANSGTTLNRFIMVSARFNRDLIPKPELETTSGVPETNTTEEKVGTESDATKAPEPEAQSKEATAKPEENGKASDKSEENSKDSGQSNDDPSQKKDDAGLQTKDEEKSAAADAQETLQFVKLQDNSPDSKKAKPAGSTKSDKGAEDKPSDKAKNDSAAKSAAKDDGATKDGKVSAAKTSDDATTSEDAKKAETKADNDDAKTDQKKSSQDEEKAALERKRLEKENERKQKEYDDKIKQGEEKAAELNARFASWYYVVSEATYRKIHLNRDDVIKKKSDAKKTDGGADTSGDTDTGADALKIPPLKLDPFKERDDATNDDENKVEEKSGDAKKDEEKSEGEQDVKKNDK
jgi:hypothetical protein